MIGFRLTSRRSAVVSRNSYLITIRGLSTQHIAQTLRFQWDSRQIDPQHCSNVTFSMGFYANLPSKLLKGYVFHGILGKFTLKIAQTLCFPWDSKPIDPTILKCNENCGSSKSTVFGVCRWDNFTTYL